MDGRGSSAPPIHAFRDGVWHCLLSSIVLCFCRKTDEVPLLQELSVVSVHEAVTVSIAGTSTDLQKRLDR